MTNTRRRSWFSTAFLLAALAGTSLSAQQSGQEFKPVSGQAGKDVVWVPTPPVLVEKMLDIAKVTSSDYVMDLGSGDGRNIIAAAKRGARAVGVEYNPDMVTLSQRLAKEAGVADKATFVQGDMYEADISKATVMALFLLPVNLMKLQQKFLDLRPGSRIVGNTFGFDEWEPDVRERVDEGCEAWCEALLWIVPAKVAGAWTMPDGGMLTFHQAFQVFTGSRSGGGNAVPITGGRLRGEEITFNIEGVAYTGRVTGDTMTGQMSGARTGAWRATRMK
jgi:SAM-dependent methyltransferase